jgi:colanic acid biosynthesis glycosyl transferase WcaI
MTLRVMLVMQWFDPEPTFKGLVFARELVRQGFEVEVVTGFPNYPGGKIYPGYRIKLIQRELIDGVEITRLPLYPNHDQSAVKRIFNYLSFAGASLIYGVFFAKKSDVLYAYHPPLTVGITASLIRLLRNTPVVYDVQDMWPDTLRATGMISSARILSVVEIVCQWVYRHVDQIVVLSPGFKRLLIQRAVPESKIKVIYNWADEAALASPGGALPPNFPSPDRFRILFAGNMGKAQALDAILEAAHQLQIRTPEICFVLLGGGIEVERLKRKAVELQLRNIVFLPPVPMAEVGTLLNSADALLVHLRRDPLFQVTIPSKTQAYMAAGKPLLMAVDGDAADLILKCDGGLVAHSEDSADIASAAESLMRMQPSERDAMGQRARDYYKQHLALTVGVGQFAALFEKFGRKSKHAKGK